MFQWPLISRPNYGSKSDLNIGMDFFLDDSA